MNVTPPRSWALVLDDSTADDSIADGSIAEIAGVLTDIDDTLTTEGAITPDALEALAQLKAVGLPVFAIPGRPMGWSMPFIAPPEQGGWPIDAIVAENGAVALFRDRNGN